MLFELKSTRTSKWTWSEKRWSEKRWPEKRWPEKWWSEKWWSEKWRPEKWRSEKRPTYWHKASWKTSEECHKLPPFFYSILCRRMHLSHVYCLSYFSSPKRCTKFASVRTITPVPPFGPRSCTAIASDVPAISK